MGWGNSTDIPAIEQANDLQGEKITNEGHASVRSNVLERFNAVTSVTVSATQYQAVGYWDSGDYLVIATRVLDGAWTYYRYDGSGGLSTITTNGDDHHDQVCIGFDPDGFLHIAYGMHGNALNYAKSNAAINTWTGAVTTGLSMVGTNESAVTYPWFLNDPAGILYFMFRDGTANAGDTYFYKYTHGTTSWAAAAGTGSGGLLIQGNTGSPTRGPYHDHAYFDSDFTTTGFMHLTWTWHRNGDTGNSDLCYVKWDGTNWKQADGTAQTVAITSANCETVESVAASAARSFPNCVVSDSSGNPISVYAKLGGDGYRHMYRAYHDGTSWDILQLTSSHQPVIIAANVSHHSLKCQAVIDRSDDTVFVFYVDDRDEPGVLLMKSDAGDYNIWSKGVLYANEVGATVPKIDFWEWERSQTAYLIIDAWIHDDGLTGTQTKLPIRIMKYSPANGPQADAVMGGLGVWTDWSDNSTITGWSSYTQKEIFYQRMGDLVFVSFNILGTSNATSANFTLPFTASSDMTLYTTTIRARDNGTDDLGYAHINGGASTLGGAPSPTAATTAWTASGDKLLRGSLIFKV
jgi:hypothetical protein